MAQLQVVCLLRPGTQEHWRRLCQTVVCSVLQAGGDHPGAGPAGANAAQRAPTHDPARTGTAPDFAGAGYLSASV